MEWNLSYKICSKLSPCWLSLTWSAWLQLVGKCYHSIFIKYSTHPHTAGGPKKHTHDTVYKFRYFFKNEFILLFDFIQIYNLKLVSMKINRGRRNQLYLRSRYIKTSNPHFFSSLIFYSYFIMKGTSVKFHRYISKKNRYSKTHNLT